MSNSSGTASVSMGEDRRFNGVKVFSATMMSERDRLGETVTEWLQAHPHIEMRDVVVTQSSDEAFHCIALTVFYWEKLAGPSL